MAAANASLGVLFDHWKFADAIAARLVNVRPRSMVSREHEESLRSCHEETAASRSPDALVRCHSERTHVQPFLVAFHAVLEGTCSSKHSGRMHLSPLCSLEHNE
ncbi:hypothetical protein C0J52_27312 [Blattella germanica]|nr:hypothetical protein C0J52_27312 [Blattella germanica]